MIKLSDYQDQVNDLQNTLGQLLDFQTNRGSDQGNTLILLSLVNLMGILNILNKKMDNSTSVPAAGGPPMDLGALQQMIGPVMSMLTKQEQGQSGAAAQNSNQNPFGPIMNLLGGGKGLANLAPLLALLGGGGQGNQNMDLTALMNMFNGLLGGKPPGNDTKNTVDTENKKDPGKEDLPLSPEDKKDKEKIIVEKRNEIKKQPIRGQ